MGQGLVGHRKDFEPHVTTGFRAEESYDLSYILTGSFYLLFENRLDRVRGEKSGGRPP